MAYTTIDDPSAFFQNLLWTGNGSNRSLTFDGNSDMQPNWSWIKQRSGTNYHTLTDSVRGLNKQLYSNANDAEATQTTNITAYGSDGVSLGTDSNVNANSSTYVGWFWKESATAGFDICSWTGNGSAQNISHNLSKVPTMIIVKNRTDSGADWYCYNVHNGNTHSILLNTNGAKVGAYSDNWNNTTPTSSVFTVGSSNSTGGSSGDNMIAYVFTDIKGYSKFGSYTGNGNADGTFVYTGFKPAFFLWKKSSDTGNWLMMDNKRSTFNFAQTYVKANATAPEDATSSDIRWDFLSNGLKCRGDNSSINSSGATYIYMAFAEQPLVTSTGVPATAR